MFKTELININTSEKRSVSFLEDDTIETVRKQIAKSSDIHHDRLFILVGVHCNRNFYLKDPRRWEALFERISLNGRPIEKELFDEYLNTYRSPILSVPYTKYDKSEWMAYPEELRDIFEPTGDFIEYRILGVELNKSYILPLKFNMFLSARIPSTQLPIPENTELFMTLHCKDNVRRFLVKEHEPDIAGAYFPLLRSTTPMRLRDEEILRMDSITKNILDLLALDAPPPKKVHILKLSWFAEFVDTDMGESIRNRFEQIFYGLTVSKAVPCITFYTGRSDVSRHKFYTENTKTKEPFLDTSMWSSWWTKSKPPRNRPTLVLYRGTSRESYDRISITSSDISLAAYRCSKNTDTIEETRESILKWFEKFDAIVPFIKTSDIETERIKLQDIRYEAVYSNILEELDTRRMNCVSDIFTELRTHKTAFRFLRTDFASENINSTDIRILEMLNDNPFLKPIDVERELNISYDEASRLLTTMLNRIKDEPWLLNKKPRGFPLFEFKSNGVIANSVSDLDRSIKYLNILQYILSDPVSKSLDKLCPKRVEKLGAIVSTTNTNTIFDDEFADLFDYIEETEEVPEKTVLNTTKSSSTYGYFHERLQKTDPQTFDPSGFPDYPRKCEQGHQPVIMTDKDLETVPEKYNPRIHEKDNKKIEISDPNGLMICPEYWCMYDKIPLSKSQLIKIDGKEACPVCNGKVQTLKDKNKDSREYSVIQKTKGYNYPGYMKHISAINKKNLPCCYKTAANTKKLSSDVKDQKYYILGETKIPLEPLRFAYVPQQILDALSIPEEYALVREAHDRIQSGLSGFFRVGLGRASQTFPQIFQRDKVNSPLHEIEKTLSCSFVSSWMRPDDNHSAEISEELKKYLLFKNDDLARERVSKILSGINTAFDNGTLTPSQEIEYSAIILGIDIYRIVIDDMTVRCTFDTVKFSKTSGIILLEYNNEIDCLCHIVRNQRNFEYRANIFKSPFPSELPKFIADDSVYKTCLSEQPEITTAFDIMKEFYPGSSDFKIILDPYGNSVAMYLQDEFILPFKTTSTPQFKNVQFMSGFSEIRNDLPTYEGMNALIKKILNKATYPEWKLYEIARELHDASGNIVELETITGLRIPIKPVESEGINEEVIQTVSSNNETDLVFGEANEEDAEKYKKISYNAEIYDFLIFQLTTDLQGDYDSLRDALSNLPKTRKKLEKSLEDWFDKTTVFMNVSEPIKFLSKIRTPCGQMNKCNTGNMCGWDKDQCKVKIRDTVSKPKLFDKILNTLTNNEKVRFMVLDGKTTPFFSTILYIELPTETILTDSQVKQT